MPLNLSIAWMEQSPRCLNYYEQSLQESGCTIEWFEFAIPALDAFTKRRYDVIVTSCRIAPGGEGEGKYPGLDKIPKPHDTVRYVIKKTREEQSANADTPIVVAGLCSKETEYFIKAGATRYLDLGEVRPSQFVRELEKLQTKI